MSTYIIGDIQGCYDELIELLDKIKFDKRKDFVWFTGDIINRGPKSLEALRFIKNLGNSANSVLGNHDIHIIAIALKNDHASIKKADNGIKQLLNAPDKDELLTWLRKRPILHKDDDLNFILTHAGIYPLWDIETAEKMAKKAENLIRGENFNDFIEKMYGNTPSKWSESLKSIEKMRFAINAFTRMRYCDHNGNLLFHYKKDLDNKPTDHIPWYALQRPTPITQRLVFGHWSALGYKYKNNTISIDTGCLWGGELSAIKVRKYGHHKISVKAKENYANIDD